jgi:flagellar hook-associated protein 1
VSDFAGLRLALTALDAQRRGVEVSAQNVANANTEGYSRQRVDLESIGSPAVPAFWSRFEGHGGGVKVADVERFRDAFMEIRAALEHGSMASLSQNATSMQALERLFNEPTDLGVAKQLSDFWGAWDDVANHPEDAAARNQLLQRAETLARTINAISSQMTQLQADTTAELRGTVVEINALSSQIADLNRTIKANTIAGIPVNELLDKRDLLANRLAEVSGGTVRSFEYNQANVVLNGTALVSSNNSYSLEVDTSGPSVAIRWADTSAIASVTSGKAGGQLTAINTTIPAYRSRLDSVVTTLRDDLNPLHGGITGSIASAAQNQATSGNLQFQMALNGGSNATVTVAGADWSGAGGAAALQTALQNAINTAIGAGNATVAVAGGNGSEMTVSITPTGTNALTVQASGTNAGFGLFMSTTAVGADGVGGRAFFTGTDAASFALAAHMIGNPNAVAAGVANGGPLDSSRALDIAELAQTEDGSDALYRQLIVQLGVDTSTAVSRDQIQSKATKALDDARAQYSGVSLDEEMTNLVMYQHAYDAAARFLSAVDEMLDTLINRTAV